MKQLGKEQIHFLLIDIEELKELTQAIDEVGGVTPSLYKLAFEKAQRICNRLKPEEEKQQETLSSVSIPVNEPEFANVTSHEKPKIEASIKWRVSSSDDEVIEPLAHPSLSENRIDEFSSLDEKDNEPSIFTQPIIIQTPTTPVDMCEPRTILNERIASIATSLSEALERRNASDLRRAFSLNDRFRFQRELFGNNVEKMEASLTALNRMNNLGEALHYVSDVMQQDMENDTVKEFVAFLEKRFSK